MSLFQVGQRWMSEAEPELGLGLVVQVAPKTVTIVFPSTTQERNYGVKSCPLKRVIFQIGEEISTIHSEKFKIEIIQDNGGVITYKGEGHSISETELSGEISFNHPEEKVFLGQSDSLDLFDLRYKTLFYKKEYLQSPVRGLMGGRMSLIPHQFYIAKEITSRSIPRVLLADEVGLGKTIEAGLILHQQIITGRVSRALIVVPDTLAYQWFVEMLRKFSLTFFVVNQETHLEEGTNPFVDKQLVITGINFLKGSPLALGFCQEASWDIMIVDEAHQLDWKLSGASAEYLIIESLAKKIEGLLLLTATPEQLGKEGHFARLRLLDPERFFDFKKFCDEGEKYLEVANKARALIESRSFEEVDKLLETHGTGRVFFRNTRQGLVKEFDFFPKRIMHTYPLEFKKVEEELDEEGLGSAFVIRVAWLSEFLMSHLDEKVLLICQSKKKILALEKNLKESVPSLKIALFHSDLTLVARDRQAAYFSETDGAQILLCTEIGSEGRNFEFARHLVLFDLPQNPDVLEQRIGRLDRIGQKNNIFIHIPYFKNSWEELLFRWYNEGFNAFGESPKGSTVVYQELKEKLQEMLKNSAQFLGKNGKKFENFLCETQEKYSKILQTVEAGRDVLIERNSFNHDKAHITLNMICEKEESMDLERYMDKVFDHLGVDAEDLDAESVYIKPGDNMFVPSFPCLDSEGVTISYDRVKAREREDFYFITWDHPMVIGVMDLIISSKFGNVAVCSRKKQGANNIFLEAFFITECVASQKLNAHRFFPPHLIRVLIDSQNVDLTDKWPKEMLDDRIEDAPGELLNKLKTIPKERLKSLIKQAEIIAQKRFSVLKIELKEEMQNFTNRDIQRLKYLKEVNPSIRKEEIILLEKEQDELSGVLEKSTLSLDSFRLIV